MQHYGTAASRRTPPPDGIRAPSYTPSVLQPPPPQAPQSPEFIIIGLFALRLAKQLIEGLQDYPGRNTDIAWLHDFVAPYPLEYALAKISGPRKDNYIATYQGIVSRMKRQPRYPMRFMQMNPDRSQQPGQGRRQHENRERLSREMTDLERLNVIDFCDAAGEWGSTVPIPALEADRMVEMADQRQIMDLDARRPIHHDSDRYRDQRT